MPVNTLIRVYAIASICKVNFKAFLLGTASISCQSFPCKLLGTVKLAAMLFQPLGTVKLAAMLFQPLGTVKLAAMMFQSLMASKYYPRILLKRVIFSVGVRLLSVVSAGKGIESWTKTTSVDLYIGPRLQAWTYT